MAPKVLYRVCFGDIEPSESQKSQLKIQPAMLYNYQRHRVKNADYPAIIPADTETASSVKGTYVTGLTDGDIWRLDIFEGDEYKRINVDVYPLQAAGGDAPSTHTPLQAQTYMWIADRQELEDDAWDFDDFVRTKMKRWTGGWEEYQGTSVYVEERASFRGEMCNEKGPADAEIYIYFQQTWTRQSRHWEDTIKLILREDEERAVQLRNS